jgi:alpha-1,2-mannosyltransferase
MKTGQLALRSQLRFISSSALVRDLTFPFGAALLVLAVVRIGLSVKDACDSLACDDFGRFWYGVSAWAYEGASLYATTPASHGDDGLLYTNLNLPSTHTLFLPFVLLPRNLAAAAWLVTGALAVLASLKVIAQETGWRPGWQWLLVFLWWMPTHVQLVTGQLAWVLLLPVTLAWAASRRDRWFASGAWIGLAVAIKPFLAPLILWLAWRRHWGAALVAVASAMLFVASGLLVFGADQFRDWLASVSVVDWYARSLNASLWGLVYRNFAPNSQFVPLVDWHGAAAAITYAACAVVIGIAWWLCRRHAEIDKQWSIVMTAILLICPLGWVYYGVLLLPGWRARWPGVAATACWLIPTPWLLRGQPSGLATLLWGSAATWGLLLAALHVVRDAPERPA